MYPDQLGSRFLAFFSHGFVYDDGWLTFPAFLKLFFFSPCPSVFFFCYCHLPLLCICDSLPLHHPVGFNVVSHGVSVFVFFFSLLCLLVLLSHPLAPQVVVFSFITLGFFLGPGAVIWVMQMCVFMFLAFSSFDLPPALFLFGGSWLWFEKSNFLIYSVALSRSGPHSFCRHIHFLVFLCFPLPLPSRNAGGVLLFHLPLFPVSPDDLLACSVSALGVPRIFGCLLFFTFIFVVRELLVCTY